MGITAGIASVGEAGGDWAVLAAGEEGEEAEVEITGYSSGDKQPG